MKRAQNYISFTQKVLLVHGLSEPYKINVDVEFEFINLEKNFDELIIGFIELSMAAHHQPIPSAPMWCGRIQVRVWRKKVIAN